MQRAAAVQSKWELPHAGLSWGRGEGGRRGRNGEGGKGMKRAEKEGDRRRWERG